MSWEELWSAQSKDAPRHVAYFLTLVTFYGEDSIARQFHVLESVCQDNEILWKYPDPLEKLEQIEAEHLEGWIQGDTELNTLTASSDYYIRNIERSSNPHVQSAVRKRWKKLAHRTPTDIKELWKKLGIEGKL